MRRRLTIGLAGVLSAAALAAPGAITVAMGGTGDGSGGARSTVKITKLTTEKIVGKVKSPKAKCKKNRRVFVQRAGFVSEKVGSTRTNSRGKWRIRKELRPGQYFAQVGSTKGCRYDTSRRKRLTGAE